MTVRDIRIFGDPILRSVGDPVDPTAPSTRQLVDDLLDTVQLPGRAGVAAQQIGVAARAFSYNVDGTVGYLLNPTITETRGTPAPISEGCLSVPNLYFPTPRYPWVRCEGVGLDGKPIVIEGEGLLAQALQHECGHLDGQLYIMTLDKEHRREAMHAIRESAWY